MHRLLYTANFANDVKLVKNILSYSVLLHKSLKQVYAAFVKWHTISFLIAIGQYQARWEVLCPMFLHDWVEHITHIVEFYLSVLYTSPYVRIWGIKEILWGSVIYSNVWFKIKNTAWNVWNSPIFMLNLYALDAHHIVTIKRILNREIWTCSHARKREAVIWRILPGCAHLTIIISTRIYFHKLLLLTVLDLKFFFQLS